MKITLQTACVSVGLAAFGYLAASAQADAWNKKTILKFNQPVEVPGHVLTPGTYVFQLADSSADRNVVQIFSEDKKGMDHLVTTTMASLTRYTRASNLKPRWRSRTTVSPHQ